MRLLHNRLFILFGGSLVSLVLFLLLTNPKHLPLMFLLVPFALLFTMLLSGWLGLMRWTGWPKLGRRHQKLVAILLSAGPVILILLSSIKQLSVRDAILSLALLAGISWYASRLNLSS
jgi:hypothetical protein